MTLHLHLVIVHFVNAKLGCLDLFPVDRNAHLRSAHLAGLESFLDIRSNPRVDLIQFDWFIVD